MHYLSAREIAAAIAANELTSVAATKHDVARIEQGVQFSPPELN